MESVKWINELDYEEQLKYYMNDLNKIYNSSLNDQSEFLVSDELGLAKNESKNENDYKKEFNFNNCKEKAREYLRKCEQINCFLNKNLNENENEFLNQEKIKALVANHESKKRSGSNSLISFCERFDVNLILSKDSVGVSQLELADFVGLDGLKTCLERFFDYLKKQTNKNGSIAEPKFSNFFAYGPPNSGKMSLVIKLLFQKRLVEDPFFKTLIVDLEKLIETDKVLLDLKLFDNLIKSIRLLNSRQKRTVFVVVQNMELIHENECLMRRYAGDLLFEFNRQNRRISELTTYGHLNECYFMILSDRPWLLPAAFVNQFEQKIFCGFLRFDRLNSSTYLKNEFEKVCANLSKNNPLFVNELTLFLTNSHLITKIEMILQESCATRSELGHLIADLELLIHKEFGDFMDEWIKNNKLNREEILNKKKNEILNSSNKIKAACENRRWISLRNKVMAVQKLSLGSQNAKNSASSIEKSSIHSVKSSLNSSKFTENLSDFRINFDRSNELFEKSIESIIKQVKETIETQTSASNAKLYAEFKNKISLFV